MSTSVSGLSSNFFPSAENGFTTTTSGSVSSGAATVGLNSVAGYTNGEIAVFVIDPTDASKKQTFTGVIDTSGVQVTSVVWTAGTNQTHALGATVVDYATATHISMVSKGILVEHDQDGTHGNITTGTIAASGAVTASSTLAVTGTTSLTGALTIKSYDGWISPTDTWTYVSATSFKITGSDVSAKFPLGTKLKLTQTTVKYFYVTACTFSTDTTVTVTGGSDYSLANAAITLPNLSYDATPQGFPQWFNWTPTFVNFTKGSATVAAKFSLDSSTVNFRLSVTLNSSTMGTAPTFSLPISSQTLSSSHPIGEGILLDNSTATWAAQIRYASTTTSLIAYWTSAGTGAGVSSTTPFTWANSDEINIQGSYEAI